MKKITFFLTLLLLTVVVLQSNALAEMALNAQGITQEVTLLEDFEDLNGDPAFDPNFIYEFLTTGNPPRETNWFLCDDDYFFSTPERKPFLFMSGLMSVSFELPEDSLVHSVSLDIAMHAHNTSVTFIGADDEKVFEWFGSYDFQTVSATANEIGNISSVKILCGEGYIDNIAVQGTVVPEPTAIISMLLIFMTIAFMKISLNRV